MLQPKPRLLTRDHLMPLLTKPGRDGMSPLDRFKHRCDDWNWAFAFTGDACWLWTGGLNRGGYGQLRVGTFGMIQAHQIAYLLKHGDIPAGMVVMHTCDVPRCCNPDHLVLGTHRQNIIDCLTKGRGNRRGAGPRVMSPELVRSIRKRNADGEAKDAIARDLGINRVTVSDAVSGKTWKHVTDEGATAA